MQAIGVEQTQSAVEVFILDRRQRFLGKGEAESSILSRSTSKLLIVRDRKIDG